MKNNIDLMYEALSVFNDDVEVLAIAIKHYMILNDKRADTYRILNDLNICSEVSLKKYEVHLIKVTELTENEAKEFIDLKYFDPSHLKSFLYRLEKLDETFTNELKEKPTIGQINTIIGVCAKIAEHAHNIKNTAIRRERMNNLNKECKELNLFEVSNV